MEACASLILLRGVKQKANLEIYNISFVCVYLFNKSLIKVYLGLET